MSHSVTIRTQTVTSSSTAVIINSGYLKTWSGLVKLLQLVSLTLVGELFPLFTDRWLKAVARFF